MSTGLKGILKDKTLFLSGQSKKRWKNSGEKLLLNLMMKMVTIYGFFLLSLNVFIVRNEEIHYQTL